MVIEKQSFGVVGSLTKPSERSECSPKLLEVSSWSAKMLASNCKRQTASEETQKISRFSSGLSASSTLAYRSTQKRHGFLQQRRIHHSFRCRRRILARVLMVLRAACISGAQNWTGNRTEERSAPRLWGLEGCFPPPLLEDFWVPVLHLTRFRLTIHGSTLHDALSRFAMSYSHCGYLSHDCTSPNPILIKSITLAATYDVILHLY
ncbi:hypothetical protein E1B28_011835 [Marasmius oreades]|uniref:Uncharacterized protein n=1 Tax=Marasmius oreades TaxID=181124 RepID=A0A9P7RVM6_9AGAR|nr:uncharacterized protein E1B28_011835 [Marasmius oreades]KAG7090235.1 hypothetical protein E1B28_011835 [Marasmius oreades]